MFLFEGLLLIKVVLKMGWLLNYSGNFVLAYDCFCFGVFFSLFFLFLLGLKFRLNYQHVQVYDDIWMLIILYPIDFRIIFSKFLLQPGPPSVHSWLRPCPHPHPHPHPHPTHARKKGKRHEINLWLHPQTWEEYRHGINLWMHLHTWEE